MKKVKGYYVLDNLKKMDKEIMGFFSNGWYTDGVNEYLFKREIGMRAYNELFYSKLLQQLGLKAAEYDLAVLGNERGVISKNYNVVGNLTVTVEEVLAKYIKEDTILERRREQKKLYNLENLPGIIRKYCQERNWLYNEKLEEDLLLQFIIQIILGNGDLQSRNIEIQYDEERQQLNLSPFYDLAYYGDIDVYNESGWSALTYHFLEKYYEPVEDARPFRVIKNFLKKADRKHVELLREYLERLEQIDLARIIMEIEERTENVMENESYHLLFSLKRNLKDVSLLAKK